MGFFFQGVLRAFGPGGPRLGGSLETPTRPSSAGRCVECARPAMGALPVSQTSREPRCRFATSKMRAPDRTCKGTNRKLACVVIASPSVVGWRSKSDIFITSNDRRFGDRSPRWPLGYLARRTRQRRVVPDTTGRPSTEAGGRPRSADRCPSRWCRPCEDPCLRRARSGLTYGQGSHVGGRLPTDQVLSCRPRSAGLSSTSERLGRA
jgi:hypothetical protein